VLGGGLVGGQEHDEVLLGVFSGGEFDGVQVEAAREGVVEAFAGGLEACDGVLCPHRPELRTCLA
jgi:hypothetical protein